MSTDDVKWPEWLASNTICFSVDEEWAAGAVLDDVRTLFDSSGITATFFVAQERVHVPGHERGIHPNFRRDGDSYRLLDNAGSKSDGEILSHIVKRTMSFAPEAKGVRSHSLHYDSTLLPVYERFGIEYDSSYRMPLVTTLRPFWIQNNVLEIPTFYADYFDIVAGATGFDARRLKLDQPGLKVFDFHPNLIYLNAKDEETYRSTKSYYRDPDRLLASRYRGRGVRTLLLEILEIITTRKIPTMTLGTVNQLWRSVPRVY